MMKKIDRAFGYGSARYEIFYPKSMTLFPTHIMSVITGQQRYTYDIALGTAWSTYIHYM